MAENKFDPDILVAAVSPESPCGENCEYDQTFLAMEQAAEGTPERQIGKTVEPAEPPDWPRVRSSALELFSRTKDIRVALALSRALLHITGWQGFSDGINILRRLLELYWQPLHPQLDPEDNDPMERISSFALLEYEQTPLLLELQQTPLVQAPALGSYSLRDHDIATGQLTVSGADEDELPTITDINRAFQESDPAAVTATAGAITRIIDDIQAIDELLQTQLGITQAPSFDNILNPIQRAYKLLAAHLPDTSPLAADETGTADPATGEMTHPATLMANPAASGEISSREDVARMLDKMCEYYARHEPSSPVPLLLNRAKGLVAKNFLDILHDIAPEAVAGVESLRGASADPDEQSS